MYLVRYLIKNPLIKWIILIIIFLAAYTAITNIKRFAFPRVDLKQVLITAVVPGFSVTEIDSRVTRKINEKLKSIDGIKKYSATSYANFATVLIEIEPNADGKEVNDNIRNEIDNISDFPSEMLERPTIKQIKVDSVPSMILGISFKEGSNNTNILDLIGEAEILRDLIRDSEFVSSVEEDIPERQIHILLNKEKMKYYEATFQEIYQSINNNQVRLSAGNLEANERVQNIITDSEKTTPSEISNIILRTGGYQLPGTPLIHLGDLGEVRYGVEKKDFFYHIQGEYGFKLDVIKKTEADIIRFSESVVKIIEDFNKNSKLAQITIHDNFAWETDLRLSITLSNGFSSFLLILATLFLCLKLPIAFWAALEMPVTIFLTLIMIWLADVTINNISLCGIILTLGIIVDNPTVIGELTMYYQDKGYSQEEASIMGLKKIIVPLIFSMLTTLTAFASMFFIPGTLGQFAVEIPLTVTFMLVSSFVESCLILPSHLAHTRKSNRKPIADSFLEFLRRVYERNLRFVFRRPILFLLVTTVIFGVVGWWSSQRVTFFLFSPEQSRKITITGKTPENSSLQYTEKAVNEIEDIIYSYPTNIVFTSISKVGDNSLNAFKIEINLTQFFERTETAKEIQLEIAERIKDKNLDLISIDYEIAVGGPPSGKPLEISVFHPDIEVRKRVIDRITAELTEMGIFTEINSDLEEGLPQQQVTASSNLYFSGIGLNQVAQVLRFAYEGILVKTSEFGNSSINWILKLDGKSVDPKSPTDNLYALSPANRITPISELVELTPTTNVSRITSENSKVKNLISISFDPEQYSGQKLFADLSKKYSTLEEENPDLEIVLGGEAKESSDTVQNFGTAIIGSLIFIYLLLVIQFRNLTQPLLVVSPIPFGIIGILFAFYAQGINISFTTLIGILGFCGVVINVSIIMIDFINSIKPDNPDSAKNREKIENTDNPNLALTEDNQTDISSTSPTSDGKNNLLEIIIEGSSARFRPIFITTASSILGFFPLAYAALGQTDSTVAPLTLGMLWGLLFGTIAAMYIVPVLYLLNERIKNWLGKFSKKA